MFSHFLRAYQFSTMPWIVGMYCNTPTAATDSELTQIIIKFIRVHLRSSAVLKEFQE
jgi:hypothetical protein